MKNALADETFFEGVAHEMQTNMYYDQYFIISPFYPRSSTCDISHPLEGVLLETNMSVPNFMPSWRVQ